VNTLVHSRRGRGLGQSTAQITQSIAGGAATIAGTAVAGPLGGQIGAAVGALAGGIADLFSGCGQTCTTASDYANVAQTSLQQNITAYFNGQISQSDALNNFNTIWSQLVSACNQPALGSAGQNCISQRQQGSCYFSKAAAPQYPGQPAAGSCWNFYNAFYSPIANDSTQPSASGNVSSSATSAVAPTTTAGGGLDITPIILLGGGAVVVLMLLL
jgi:hypothetical protein